MDSDPLPPVELIELDEPAAKPARVQMGGGPNRRRWLALALIVVVALVVVAIVQGGADDTSESSPTSLDPSVDQGPFSENLVPFERRATSTTVALPPVVPNAVNSSLVIERGGDVDVVDLATGVRRDLAVIADAAGVVAVRGGLIQADGDATLHPIDGGEPVSLGAADVVRRTERSDAIWLVRQPDDGAGSATLVGANGTVLASPLEIPANAEVTGATTRWLLLSAYDRTYVLGLDGVLRPTELPAEVTPTGSNTVVYVGCDDSARCGPRVLDLAAATSRPLVEPDALPRERGHVTAEPGGERVAVAAADANVVVIWPDGISVAIPGAVRDPAWLPGDMGLLALSDTGQLLHWTPDGQVRPLDLTVDDASHILVVTG